MRAKSDGPRGPCWSARLRCRGEGRRTRPRCSGAAGARVRLRARRWSHRPQKRCDACRRRSGPRRHSPCAWTRCGRAFCPMASTCCSAGPGPSRPAGPTAWRPRPAADLGNFTLSYDGAAVTLFTPAQNVYAAGPLDRDLERAVAWVEERLGIEIPVRPLLAADPYAALMAAGPTTGMLVGRSFVRDTAVDHFALRNPSADWEIWLETSRRALPLRVSVVQREEGGGTRMTMEFSDWNLAPRLTDRDFVFVPPRARCRPPWSSGPREVRHMPQVSTIMRRVLLGAMGFFAGLTLCALRPAVAWTSGTGPHGPSRSDRAGPPRSDPREGRRPSGVAGAARPWVPTAAPRRRATWGSRRWPVRWCRRRRPARLPGLPAARRRRAGGSGVSRLCSAGRAGRGRGRGGGLGRRNRRRRRSCHDAAAGGRGACSPGYGGGRDRTATRRCAGHRHDTRRAAGRLHDAAGGVRHLLPLRPGLVAALHGGAERRLLGGAGAMTLAEPSGASMTGSTRRTLVQLALASGGGVAANLLGVAAARAAGTGDPVPEAGDPARRLPAKALLALCGAELRHQRVLGRHPPPHRLFDGCRRLRRAPDAARRLPLRQGRGGGFRDARSRVRLSRPLDFLVVADHSDGMGFFPRLIAGEPEVMADPNGRRWHNMVRGGGEQGGRGRAADHPGLRGGRASSADAPGAGHARLPLRLGRDHRGGRGGEPARPLHRVHRLRVDVEHRRQQPPPRRDLPRRRRQGRAGRALHHPAAGRQRRPARTSGAAWPPTRSAPAARCWRSRTTAISPTGACSR